MSHFFHHTAEQWSSLMQNAGIQAALVAVLACLFLFVTQRFISSPLRYAILLVVLVKFATPPFLDLPTGFFTKYSVMRNTPVSSTIITLVADEPGDGEIALEQTDASEARRSPVPDSPAPKTTGVASQPAAPLPAPVVSKPESEFSWTLLLLPLYLIGSVVFAGLLIRRYRMVRRIVRAGALQQEGFLFSEVTRLSELLRMKKVPALRISDETDAPFAMGAFRPVIVLPRAITEQLENDQLTIVIAHELAHIRRRDLLIGWFETVVSIVWWFHPALWWLRKSLRQTREDCCDDLLLAHQLAEPERYCETLIEAASRQSTRLAEPLVLGFVHRVHPAARRIRRLMNVRLFRADRLRYPALIFTVLFALIMLPGLRPEQQPVTETTLEGWLGWRNLPFRIDAGEEAAVKECQKLAQSYFYTRSDVRDFTLPQTREKLEAILKTYPKLFYAQQLLGTWHRINGNHEEAQRLLKESLANAPVVLTQTYRLGNGKPIQGVPVEQVEIECNRVQNGSLDPSLNLKFVALITDSQGQVHLPVYNTVYRTNSQSYPKGYHAEYQNQGWIVSHSRKGLLPDVFVWKTWSRPRYFTRTAAESPRFKGVTGTDTREIQLGANRFQIGAVARGQDDGTFITEDGKGQSVSKKRVLPEIKNGTYMDHGLIDLETPESSLFSISQVEVLDSQTKIPLHSFQYGAGYTRNNDRQVRLFSLWDQLPETVDLILKVYNYSRDDFRYSIPAKEGASVALKDARFEITYLRAGNHVGWNSNSGFYGEAMNQKRSSEILFKITGNRERKFSLWVITKAGREVNLKSSGWFSARMGNGRVRIMQPLDEIDHFELRPNIAAEAIAFEQIQLPARKSPLEQELPEVLFPVDGQAQKYTSDVLSPLRVHFESERGNLYMGTGISLKGFELQERPSKDHFPDQQMTVIWYYHGRVDLKHRLKMIYDSPSDSAGGNSSHCSSLWGHAGYASRKIPLKSVKAVRLEVLPKPE